MLGAAKGGMSLVTTGGAYGVVGMTLAGTSTPSSYHTNSLFFKPDGLSIFAGDYDNALANIYEFNLTTAWDISTLSTTPDVTYDASSDVSEVSESTYNQFTGVSLSKDGLKMIGYYREDNTFYEFDLSPAWDLSSATLTDTLTASASAVPMAGMTFSLDGKYAYGAYRTGNSDVWQFECSTGFDLSTLTSQSSSWTNLATVGDITTWAISPNGEYAYCQNYSTDAIWVGKLSTPFDLEGSFSYSGSNLVIPSSTSTPSGLYIRQDGKYLYMADANGYIRQYNLINDPDY